MDSKCSQYEVIMTRKSELILPIMLNAYILYKVSQRYILYFNQHPWYRSIKYVLRLSLFYHTAVLDLQVKSQYYFNVKLNIKNPNTNMS